MIQTEKNDDKKRIENLENLKNISTEKKVDAFISQIENSKKELKEFSNKLNSQIQERKNKTKAQENAQIQKEINNVANNEESKENKKQKVIKPSGPKFTLDDGKNQNNAKNVNKNGNNTNKNTNSKDLKKNNAEKFVKNEKLEKNANIKNSGNRNNQNQKIEDNQNKNRQRQNNNGENKNFGQKYNKDNTNAGQRTQKLYNKDGQNNKNKNDLNGKKPVLNQNGQKKVAIKPVEKIIVKDDNRQFGNKNKTHQAPQERKKLNEKQKRRMGIISDDVNEDSQTYMRSRTKKKEEIVEKPEIARITHAVITTENITVKTLSETISRPSADIVKKLLEIGMLCTINSTIDFETAELVSNELGITLEKKLAETMEEKLKSSIKKESDANSKFLRTRAPIVTIMGHVDHGKTSLLDAIRNSNVVSKEAGGITQKIGAYSVRTSKGSEITFIDTPGHEAFMGMRERGAKTTDIAVLIVAADDGVMPQTLESIRIIKECDLPMIVAINKIDKPGADIEKVKAQLDNAGVIIEEWGGDVMCVEISAQRNNPKNIDELLDSIALLAEILELKGNPVAKASGYVLESGLDKGVGPVASIIVTNGTLNVGDTVVCGSTYGKIRSLIDENGKKVKKVGLSTPVTIYGLDSVPAPGDELNVADEKLVKALISERKREIERAKEMRERRSSFDELQKKKILGLVVKTDSQGSAQAIKDAIEKIENEEIKIKVLTAEAGIVSENDILTASNSETCMVLCFNQKCNPKARQVADKMKMEIKEYSVIYQLIDDVTEKAKSMMEPKYKEVPIGKAEVRMVFNLSSAGIIAGSYVLEGKMQRGAKCRVYRKNTNVKETEIIGLKNKKEDVKEIGVQFECGIKLDNFDEVKEGDIIEAYILERIN